MESKIYSPLSNHVYVLNGDDIETIDIIMWSASRAYRLKKTGDRGPPPELSVGLNVCKVIDFF